MEHDPLCPVIATDCAQCPQCDLIARVRADERKHIAREIAHEPDLVLELLRAWEFNSIGYRRDLADRITRDLAAAIAQGGKSE